LGQSLNNPQNAVDVLTAYCSTRQVISVEQVIERLEYQSVDDSNSSTIVELESLENRFVIAFARYLRGTVLLQEEGLFSNTSLIVSATNPTSRCRLFLQAVTGSEYLPLNREKIKVCYFFSTMLT
jgi:hypothetical protein